MYLNKSNIYSVLALLLLVTPHVLLSILPRDTSGVYLYVIYGVTILFVIGNSRDLVRKNRNAMIFSMTFILFGLVNLFIKGVASLFNLIGPLLALFGFVFLRKNKFNLSYFNVVLIFFYVYFYFVYYSILPDLFYRPGFDEDEVVFDNSSSNAIPMALNMILYIYLILNKYFGENRQRIIYIFSAVNLVLALIQQSRAGILIAVLLLGLALYEYKPHIVKKMYPVLVTLGIFLALYNYDKFLILAEVLTGDKGLMALSADIRGRAQSYFLMNLDVHSFFFGYPVDTIFAVSGNGNAELNYTYNVLLDVWNRYGFFQFIILLIVLIQRIKNYKKYFFPLYFFIPFIVYSLVESIFFPNFWDCFIYLLIFIPKEEVVLKLNAND